jgi:peptidoglycan/LPS O-acetylase OafA/YrhL
VNALSLPQLPASSVRRTGSGVNAPRDRGRRHSQFRADIEGLRAVAVILVLLNHARLPLFSGGYVGVDVFFVISGFLITGLLLAEHEQHGQISLVGFYARRVRRILPAASVVLIATGIGSALIFGGTRAGRVADDARWATLFASNFRFIQQGTNYWASNLPASPLLHYWSLGVEEQFYLVWPTCFVVLAFFLRNIALRKKLLVFLFTVIGASLVWSIYRTADNPTVAYFSPVPRACELATGAVLAVAEPRIAHLPRPVGSAIAVLGLVMIGLAALMYDADTQFPGYALALPVCGAALTVGGGTAAGGAGAEWLLGHEPLQWIGRHSYSIYLWHWPILVTAGGYFARDLSPIENLVLCVGALALSAVTFRWVERPIRNSRWLRARPSLVSVAVGAGLILLSIGVTAELRMRFPAQSLSEQSPFQF